MMTDNNDDTEQYDPIEGNIVDTVFVPPDKLLAKVEKQDGTTWVEEYTFQRSEQADDFQSVSFTDK